jgi:L-lactate dehydrogenase (cytochrome)
MRLSEARALVQLRKPERDRVARILRRCVTIEDLQHAAWRRWPRGVRGYVEGGADGEVSMARNRAAYQSLELVPSTLRDVADVDLRTLILGGESALPFALAPTGYNRMMHTGGELAVARAARDAGIPYTLSTMATTRLEDVAGEVGGDLWFQLYVWRDRGLVRDLIERAKASGYRALMLTVDTRSRVCGWGTRTTASPSHRSSVPRPCWTWPATPCGARACWPATRSPSPTSRPRSAGTRGRDGVRCQAVRPSVSWEDLAWIRGLWQGPLMVKGMVNAQDVVRAADAGVDAVVLSNHGGRQLDQVVAPLEVLPEVRERVGDRLDVLVDSGIRRGSDIALALALGADGVLVGRPYLYGSVPPASVAVAAAISMMGGELRRAMTLMGVTSVAQLRAEGSALVRPRD